MYMPEGSDPVVGPSPTVTAPSLLGKLHCPQPLDISRKRRVPVSPPRGKRQSAGRGNFISVAARVRVP